MSDIINLLPDSIANQIAAGEVVQRPASVVKELLENSVDAKSSKIQLVINDAGKQLIQVIDDGIGMSETDARMSFERHATSKIRESEDLFKIATMGFRGEALASIAAVARVELKTKQSNSELGTFIHIEASEVKKQEPTNQSKGTNLAVKNLFYNVPARRNFLKSNPVETKHILDEFQRVALAHPEISFLLRQNEKETYNLLGGKLSQRIVGLFGKNYQKNLIACSEETNWLKVTGYIGKPEFSKKTRGEQFFFVNDRFIKSGYLNHAITGAYEGLLKDEQHPFYALFIEIDPVHIDINVHPTKTEIKFDDERSVYGIIKAAVKQALGTHNVTPSLDFGTDVNFESFAVKNMDFGAPKVSSSKDRSYGSFKSLNQGTNKQAHWEQLYQSAMQESMPSPQDIQKEEMAGSFTPADLSSKPTESKLSAAFSHKTETPSSKSIPVLMHDKYIMKQMPSGIMVMDIRLANERILYELYLERLKSQKGSTQRCLFPVNLELSPSDFALIVGLKDEIAALGFEFEEFGQNSIAINGIPAEAQHMNEKELFEGLLEQFKHNQAELSLSIHENLARSMSKRSANRTKISGDKLELTTLIDRLFACAQPNYTPKGTPTFVILGLEKIADLFNQ
ncbi:DNA mismatch repair endonuclease MutL [Reichenbachiella versicolor]|uniref:DNA mismatch repair endonuclease MutL n=1 Tax=Reichenbachiella versicolor TaxID=1821036 RepID=UPI000D6E76AE|nr:DNA mismatch repair endonuclease MutL [Reichenbachiella versicolor]